MTRYLALAALVAGAVVAAPRAAHAQVVINELYINPPSTDGPKEYVELRNTTAVPLTLVPGTYLVGVEGDSGGNPGDVQTIFDLSGLTIPASGYLVLLQGGTPYTADAAAHTITGTGTGWTGVAGFQSDTGTDIENASASYLLITAPAAPTLTDDIDANDDGTADGAVFATWVVLDSVAILDGGATDRTYAAITFANGGIGSGGIIVNTGTVTAGYVGRRGDTTGSTEADWVAADTTGTAPNFSLLTGADPASLVGAPLDHIGRINFQNDAPSITVPAAQTTAEDTPLALSTAGGNLIAIADSDAAANAEKLSLAVSSGTLTLKQTTGLTFASGADGTGAMVVTGTLSALDAALDGMTFTPAANASGSETLTIGIDDQGATGLGGNLTASATLSIDVTAVNDPPVLTVPGAQTVLVSASYPFSAATSNAITIADADAGAGSLTVTITTDAGTLSATATGGATVTGNGTASLQLDGTLAALDATLDTLVFAAPATAANATFTLVANDNGNTGGPAQTDTKTIAVTVTSTPFLDAPAGPFAFTTALAATSPEQSFMVTAGNLGSSITVTAPAAFEVSDTSGGTFGATITLPMTGGMVFVRYHPTSGTSHTGDVTYAATGLTTPPTTALTGTVFAITTASLPGATEGVAYAQSLTEAGGVSPYTWSLTTAPAWLSIDASSGALSGTPPLGSNGQVQVTVQVSDAQTPAQVASATFTLDVAAAPLPDAGVPDAAPPSPDAAPSSPDARPGSDAGVNPMTTDKGCCSTSSSGVGWLPGAALVALVGLRRRRRR